MIPIEHCIEQSSAFQLVLAPYISRVSLPVKYLHCGNIDQRKRFESVIQYLLLTNCNCGLNRSNGAVLVATKPMPRTAQDWRSSVITTTVVPVSKRCHWPYTWWFIQDVADTMSTMFVEASEKSRETPGQTTTVVRAYVSVALHELTSANSPSDSIANNTYQVSFVRHDSASSSRTAWYQKAIVTVFRSPSEHAQCTLQYNVA